MPNIDTEGIKSEIKSVAEKKANDYKDKAMETFGINDIKSTIDSKVQSAKNQLLENTGIESLDINVDTSRINENNVNLDFNGMDFDESSLGSDIIGNIDENSFNFDFDSGLLNGDEINLPILSELDSDDFKNSIKIQAEEKLKELDPASKLSDIISADKIKEKFSGSLGKFLDGDFSIKK